MYFKKSLLTMVCALFLFSCSNSKADSQTAITSSSLAVSKNAVETQNEFVGVSNKLKDSVVNIRTKKTVYVNYYNPIEQFLYGRSEPRTEKKESGSLGSGFIISADGYVMTNNHVVNGADEIFVKFSDGRELEAKLVGNDPEVDIAILKIQSKETFKPAEFGNSDNISVGQWAIAFGNPLGLNDTMTVGIVSAKGRSSLGIEKIENFIQTDAAINQGNSGGPLVDISGKVIGINTAIYSPSGGSIGIGFAIPANLAVNIKDSIIRTGKVERAFLGTELQDLNPQLVKQFNLSTSNGVLVTNVTEGSPAEKAGLKSGDVITQLNDSRVNSASQLVAQIASLKVGSNISLTYIRDGKTYKTSTVLSKRAETAVSQTAVFSGLSLKALTKQDIQKYGGMTGLVVTNVAGNTEAAKIGIQPGMIVRSINRVSVNSLEDFKKVYDRIQKGASMLILIATPNGSQYITLKK
ncbi:MAG: Do family serine endopeptidase [Fusobacteriales bacterium]|jgi:serine protease Do|nr:Do family serine endopeptidase [Fusobacteriales bacterium]